MIRLLGADGVAPVECEFPRSGLLFVVSDRAEIKITEMPAHGALLYAVIVHQGRKIFGATLRADASINGSAQALLGKGDVICIGRERFTFAQGKKNSGFPGAELMRPRRPVKFLLIVAAVVAVCSAAFFCLTRGKVQSAEHASSAKLQQAPEPDRNGFIDEARRLLRDGRNEQARLALMEAAERDPSGEAARMLEALNSSALQKVEADKSIADQETMARSLFDSGRRKMESGDAAGAYRDFLNADKALRNLGAAPPFAAAVNQALREAKILVEQDVLERIGQADALIAGARLKNAETSVVELARAVAIANSAIELMPESKDVDAAAARARAELAAHAARWIASAKAAEQLSGCDKAVLIYERISKALAATGESQAREASERASSCRREMKGR